MGDFILMDNEFELPDGYAIKVMMHLAAIMDNGNIVWDTKVEIAEDMGVSQRTIMRSFEELIKLDIIKKYMNKVYVVNPNYIRKDIEIDEEENIEYSNNTLIEAWGRI